MSQQNNRFTAQSGGALIYVFIGVALFALLAFTFSKSFNSTSSSTMTVGQAKIQATQLMNIGNNIKRAVEKLLAKGCSETQLSFYKAGPYPGDLNTSTPFTLNAQYDNPTAGSADCGVFDANEGGAKVPMNTPTYFSSWANSSETWGISPNNIIIGLGSDDSGSGCVGCELAIISFDVKPEICEFINSNFGISGVPTFTGDINGDSFLGGFYGADFLGDSVTPTLQGKDKFCVIDSLNRYTYVHVLIAR